MLTKLLETFRDVTPIPTRLVRGTNQSKRIRVHGAGLPEVNDTYHETNDGVGRIKWMSETGSRERRYRVHRARGPQIYIAQDSELSQVQIVRAAGDNISILYKGKLISARGNHTDVIRNHPEIQLAGASWDPKKTKHCPVPSVSAIMDKDDFNVKQRRFEKIFRDEKNRFFKDPDVVKAEQQKLEDVTARLAEIEKIVSNEWNSARKKDVTDPLLTDLKILCQKLPHDKSRKRQSVSDLYDLYQRAYIVDPIFKGLMEVISKIVPASYKHAPIKLQKRLGEKFIQKEEPSLGLDQPDYSFAVDIVRGSLVYKNFGALIKGLKAIESRENSMPYVIVFIKDRMNNSSGVYHDVNMLLSVQVNNGIDKFLFACELQLHTKTTWRCNKPHNHHKFYDIKRQLEPYERHLLRLRNPAPPLSSDAERMPKSTNAQDDEKASEIVPLQQICVPIRNGEEVEFYSSEAERWQTGLVMSGSRRKKGLYKVKILGGKWSGFILTVPLSCIRLSSEKIGLARQKYANLKIETLGDMDISKDAFARLSEKVDDFVNNDSSGMSKADRKILQRVINKVSTKYSRKYGAIIAGVEVGCMNILLQFPDEHHQVKWLTDAKSIRKSLLTPKAMKKSGLTKNSFLTNITEALCELATAFSVPEIVADMNKIIEYKATAIPLMANEEPPEKSLQVSANMLEESKEQESEEVQQSTKPEATTGRSGASAAWRCGMAVEVYSKKENAWKPGTLVTLVQASTKWDARTGVTSVEEWNVDVGERIIKLKNDRLRIPLIDKPVQPFKVGDEVRMKDKPGPWKYGTVTDVGPPIRAKQHGFANDETWVVVELLDESTEEDQARIAKLSGPQKTKYLAQEDNQTGTRPAGVSFTGDKKGESTPQVRSLVKQSTGTSVASDAISPRRAGGKKGPYHQGMLVDVYSEPTMTWFTDGLALKVYMKKVQVIYYNMTSKKLFMMSDKNIRPTKNPNRPSAQDRKILEDLRDGKEIKKRQMPKKGGARKAKRPTAKKKKKQVEYVVGDSVHVFSSKKMAWFSDGLITKMHARLGLLGAYVSYNNGENQKWFPKDSEEIKPKFDEVHERRARGDVAAQKPVKWDVPEVSQWLLAQGIGHKYINRFADWGVDGSMLLCDIDESELVDLMRLPPPDAEELFIKIRELKIRDINKKFTSQEKRERAANQRKQKQRKNLDAALQRAKKSKQVEKVEAEEEINARGDWMLKIRTLSTTKIEEWDVDMVGWWLQEIRMGRHIDLFNDLNINGNDLEGNGMKNRLEDSGISPLHVKKIMRERDALIHRPYIGIRVGR